MFKFFSSGSSRKLEKEEQCGFVCLLPLKAAFNHSAQFLPLCGETQVYISPPSEEHFTQKALEMSLLLHFVGITEHLLEQGTEPGHSWALVNDTTPY